MPKDPTVPRTRTATSAPKARAGASSVQPTRAFPPRTNNQPRSSNQRTQQWPAILPPRGPEKHPQDDESDVVHANCNTIFKKADQDRRQLTSQLREATDATRRGNSELLNHEGKHVDQD
ncbi:hypothetical protein N7444_006859 [Penicillium canescens]|uniref:Uncharacterized protein n=1 Tax=Penicillium arizonense TaxID=1835702 RepID=A0A1F5L275_PENAI|nr:hypothetical protein PENARI_c074G00023 [Penicillium arizonense]KAJ6050143.1 hypothetical protein N7444_006859 [Penicillium canescens]OGE47021.1 hypothetical protein PENARI_c074G00023 [Penicillium arizonense]